MNRIHNRDRFFKYVSVSTALAVLERSAVRYSSPLIFNDPFDIQSGLHFPFDIDVLHEKVMQRMKELVTADQRPQVDEEDDWGKAIIIAWENRARRDLPEFFLRPLLQDLCDRIADYQSQCQHLWGSIFLPRLRVFSVSEDPDNVIMWSHYAQNHAGAVFAFKVLIEEDNALRAAEPVIYRNEPPVFFSEQEWIGFILGAKPLDPKPFFLEYAYVKSDHWAYEKEWWVWTLEARVGQELFTDYELLPEELEAVYLGCKMEADQKAAITRLITQKYPGTQIFQARRPVEEYRLHFDQL